MVLVLSGKDMWSAKRARSEGGSRSFEFLYILLVRSTGYDPLSQQRSVQFSRIYEFNGESARPEYVRHHGGVQVHTSTALEAGEKVIIIRVV
jgi:hypothetical protein